MVPSILISFIYCFHPALHLAMIILCAILMFVFDATIAVRYTPLLKLTAWKCYEELSEKKQQTPNKLTIAEVKYLALYLRLFGIPGGLITKPRQDDTELVENPVNAGRAGSGRAGNRTNYDTNGNNNAAGINGTSDNSTDADGEDESE